MILSPPPPRQGLRAAVAEAWPSTVPGAFRFTVGASGERVLEFICPCGCRSMGHVRVYGRGSMPLPGPTPSWAWDGNTENPTIWPAVLMSEKCGWRGFLTDGRWYPSY